MEPRAWGQCGKYLPFKIEKMGDSEFDFLQEEFLATRYKVEKAQDIKEKEGYTTSNAGIGV